ncbi:MAG TPA: hypothetical protein VJM77_00085 [Nitrospiria bacterium]|nr:hypothetical protein [Nitrospiria bacterium]
MDHFKSLEELCQAPCLNAGGSGQGRFLGTGSPAVTVLGGPRVSATPASEAIDGAASDTASA